MSDNPNRIELSGGAYLLFDYFKGQYRIVVYTRRSSKSESLREALSRALGKPLYDKKILEIAEYIETVPKYESLSVA